MNIILWIVQILLALLFLFSGGLKLVLSSAELQRMGSPDAIHFPVLFIRFIGVCEVLGGLGLILPGLLKIRKGLTPLAVVGLTIIMVGAVIVTVAGEGVSKAVVPLVAGVLCVFVAYGRRDWRTVE